MVDVGIIAVGCVVVVLVLVLVLVLLSHAVVQITEEEITQLETQRTL